MRSIFKIGRPLYFVTAALLLLCLGAAGQRSVPLAGLLSDQAVVFNPANQKAYTVDAKRGAIVVIDTRTQVRSEVKVGDSPVAIAVDPITNILYVANNGSGSISVLDGRTDAVTATVAVGKSPYVLAVNEVTGKVYVSNTFSDVLSVIDVKTNAVHVLKAGSFNKIVVDSKRNLIYLLGYEDDNVKILDGSTEKLRRASAGALHLWDVAFDRSTGEAFVARIENRDVASLATPLHGSSTISVGAMPCAIRIDGKRNRMYVLNYADNSVTVVDNTNHLPIATIPVGERPQAIAIDEGADLIYVANTHGNSVSVIDGIRLKTIATLPAGRNPYALAIDPQNGTVYAADLSDQAVAHVDVNKLRTSVH